MKNPLEDFSFSDPFLTWWPFLIALLVGVITALRAFIVGPQCPCKDELDGKLVVITGGSRGIGLQVAVELLKRQATVIVGTRDLIAAKQTIQTEIKLKNIDPKNKLIILKLDLSSFRSVREFVDAIDAEKVDILVNNAGIAHQPFFKAEDGFEGHFTTNYLGHFLLTNLLFPKLKIAEGRVINVGGKAHEEGILDLDNINESESYTSHVAFARSKLALMLMTRYLAAKWQKFNISINAVDPGSVQGTDYSLDPKFKSSLINKYMAWLLMKTPQQAAQTIIYLAIAPELNSVSGTNYCNCSETTLSETALDMEIARHLYKKSVKMTNLNTETELKVQTLDQ